MEQKEQNYDAENDTDATLVTSSPLFDDEATQVARPVVPLTVGATSTSTAVASAEMGDDFASAFNAQTSTPYAVSAGVLGREVNSIPTNGTRRYWFIGLILLSALVGSVLGGAGLRFYQKRQQRAAAQQPAPDTAVSAEAAQPPSRTGTRTADQNGALPVETSATAKKSSDAAGEAETSAAARATAVMTAVRGVMDDAERRAEHRSSKDSVEVRSNSREADEVRAVEALRRGKKREDDDRQRDVARVRRSGSDDEGDAELEARRAERSDKRRAARRERGRRESQPTLDSVRSIFEGPPR